MTNMIIRRLIQLPIILLCIYTITFVLAWLLPGNPLEHEGRRPPAEIEQAMLAQYNLDNPFKFYFSYLEDVTGIAWAKGESDTVINFGPSLQYKDWTVNELISGTLPVSMLLGLASIILALAIGLLAGVVGAAKPGSFSDFVTLVIALIGISMPTFVIGTALLLLFAVKWPVFKVGSWGSFSDIVLPAITLCLPYAAYIARLTRLGMIDVLGEDYIRTARAKGVSEMRVHLHHALKVAFLPVLSYLGPATAAVMTGSFVVEKVFNVPGIGQHFVDSVRNKDLFLIMGVVLTFSTLLIIFNLIVDVLYRWVDPRIDVTT